MFTYYSNQSIRKLVIAFGTLFNNINIVQKDRNGNDVPFKVALTYTNKEKFFKRLTQPSSISDRTRVEISVPQMGFQLMDMMYDNNRKLNKTNLKADGTYSSYSEAPYNFTFGLYAYTRNIEENLQIIEQILPQFNPEFILSLNMTDLHKKVDVPIILQKSVLTQEAEGDFSSRRSIISSFQFMAKSYVYNRVKEEPTINEFTFDAYDHFGITYING